MNGRSVKHADGGKYEDRLLVEDAATVHGRTVFASFV